jgi:hypothetical protein
MSRDASASLAPAPPNARAMALPSPLLAPVMSATLPARFWFCMAKATRNEETPAIRLPQLRSWLSPTEVTEFQLDCLSDLERCDNTSAKEIQFEPKSIVAWKAGNGVTLNQNQLQSEDDLVNLLMDRVKQYSKIVESLLPVAGSDTIVSQ